MITPGATNFGPFRGQVFADSWNLLRGTHRDGEVGALKFSDDSYLRFLAGRTADINEPAVWIELEGFSPDLYPDSLTFRLESKANSFNLEQNIEIYNFDDQQYHQIDLRAATWSDSFLELNFPEDVARFVDARTGNIKTRISWQAVGPVLASQWSVSIDQAFWSVNAGGSLNLFAGGGENTEDQVATVANPTAFAVAGRNYQARSITPEYSIERPRPVLPHRPFEEWTGLAGFQPARTSEPADAPMETGLQRLAVNRFVDQLLADVDQVLFELVDQPGEWN